MNLPIRCTRLFAAFAFLTLAIPASEAAVVQSLDTSNASEDRANNQSHAVSVNGASINVFDVTEDGADRTTTQSISEPGDNILNYRVLLLHTSTDTDGSGNMFFLEIGDGLNSFARLSINRNLGTDRLGRSDGSPTQISNPQTLTSGTEYEVSLFMNNTGGSLEYSDPLGNTQTLEDDTYDIWFGPTNGDLSLIQDGQTAENASISNLNTVHYRMRSVAKIQYDSLWSPISWLQGTLATETTTVLGPFTVDVTFGEDVAGLEESDFEVTNAAVTSTSLAGSGSIYSIEINPLSTGPVTVLLKADSVTALNGDEETNPASNLLEVTYLAEGSDQPVATLSTQASTVTIPFIVDLSFSEAVTGLELEDLFVDNGIASNLEGSEANYSFNVTPDQEGEVTINIPHHSVTDTDGDQLQNPASDTLKVTYEIPANPTVSLYTRSSSASPTYEVFVTFSEEVTGLEDSDFQVVNGFATGTVSTSSSSHDTHLTALKGRFYKTTITASKPGDVEVTLPAGAVNAATSLQEPSLASNTMITTLTSDFGETWTIDDADSWTAGAIESSNLEISDGFAKPTATSSTFTSIVKTYSRKRQAFSLTFKQSPVWDNWNTVSNVGPSAAQDAPIFLPVANDDYYFLGKGSTSAYYAWHSNDMVNWTGPSRVTQEGGDHGRWATSAEYKDGKFYVLYDGPNDEDPALYVDDDLMDGVVGEKVGTVFRDSSHGSDSSFFRNDEDGLFHIIYEDWSPIDARSHAWDSPLAGHTSSPDGISGFYPHEHQPVVDHRTAPTGRISSYTHPNGSYTYEIHEPGQDAYGDWTTIKVGSQFYLFSDFDPHGSGIKIARFTSDSIYKEFKLVGSLGRGHPDPTVGFAEGQFYLITQQSTDYVSPGPWVDGVEARAGVDTDGNGTIDQWTDWQTVSESYDHKPGYARVVDVTPAQLELSGLPAGYGFQFEFRIDNTLIRNVSPIMDRVELAFEPGNFQNWANNNGTAALPRGDHNNNGTPNLIEFALGQDTLPNLQPKSMSLDVPIAREALEEEYEVEVWFSEDLIDWKSNPSELQDGLSLDGSRVNSEGNTIQQFSFTPTLQMLFWRIAVSEP